MVFVALLRRGLHPKQVYSITHRRIVLVGLTLALLPAGILRFASDTSVQSAQTNNFAAPHHAAEPSCRA